MLFLRLCTFNCFLFIYFRLSQISVDIGAINGRVLGYLNLLLGKSSESANYWEREFFYSIRKSFFTRLSSSLDNKKMKVLKYQLFSIKKSSCKSHILTYLQTYLGIFSYLY